jgi:hypothetical protein
MTKDLNLGSLFSGRDSNPKHSDLKYRCYSFYFDIRKCRQNPILHSTSQVSSTAPLVLTVGVEMKRCYAVPTEGSEDPSESLSKC